MTTKFKCTYLAFIIFLSLGIEVYAQKTPFQTEIEIILEKYPDNSFEKGGIVFTGSSSIRLWKSLDADFPEITIINTGFGGSQTHEVLEYMEETVLRYFPSKVFIYVGENDIQSGKPIENILNEYETLYDGILNQNPNAMIYMISAKPSPSRWEKSAKMILLNQKTKSLSDRLKNMTFISVWDEMLDTNGSPNEALFIQDRLHMNEKGYSIWADKIKQHL
ncbi:GDSL-type esterase/lipase family protein [Belliella marina]|uniref:GDSL-type esterase/lipase family protein n=1 Tax=Belliella marina TaxID=1644146 RepID=A0ABW4VU78_9BACT